MRSLREHTCVCFDSLTSKRHSDDGLNAGEMQWAAFLESMDAPHQRRTAEQGLLSKTGVPPEAVTLSRLGQVLFNFGVKTLIIAAGAIAYRDHVPLDHRVAPFCFLLIVALGGAIRLILAPINVLYGDVASSPGDYDLLIFHDSDHLLHHSVMVGRRSL